MYNYLSRNIHSYNDDYRIDKQPSFTPNYPPLKEKKLNIDDHVSKLKPLVSDIAKGINKINSVEKNKLIKCKGL
jgi:hypothetical protein